MRPAWRLALTSLHRRRGRASLLVAAIALSSALIGSIACATATVNAAIEARLSRTVGRADVRLLPVGDSASLTPALLAQVRGWAEAELAAPRVQESLASFVHVPLVIQAPGGAFRRIDHLVASSVVVNGVEPEAELRMRPLELAAGRMPQTQGEIAIDEMLADRLSLEPLLSGRMRWPTVSDDEGEPAPGIGSFDHATSINLQQRVELGGEIQLRRLFRDLGGVRVVGIVSQPPLGGRPQAFMTIDGLAALLGSERAYTDIAVALRDGIDPAGAIEHRREGLPAGVIIETTERVTTGVGRNMRSSQLGMILITILAFLSAAFIILTGLSIDVGQRQRELAIVRCIGGHKNQLAQSQLMIGGLLGLIGAAIGVPLGVLLAWVGISAFHEQLQIGLRLSPIGLLLAGGGSIGTGLLGALYPALKSARVSPLVALAPDAAPPSRRGLMVITLCGLAGVGLQLALMLIPGDSQAVFWGYATVGLPAMYVGYFLLAVPVMVGVTRVLGPALSRVAGLPRGLLVETISTTPYRFGLTAGALMGGLALMIAHRVNGGSFLRDWVAKIDFPDAFVSGIDLTEQAQTLIDELPFVENSCAIALHTVETDAFGVHALQTYNTTFIAFEPAPFFAMTSLTWVQGDPAQARRELERGGSVIVAREFLVAQGLGVGDTFTCTDAGESHDFRIVGVVTSPGLEIVSKFFNVGDEYQEQSMHAVFGSRDDLRRCFGSGAVHLIQIDLRDDVDDQEAIERIERDLVVAGIGILDAGSGRWLKQDIRDFVGGFLLVTFAVSIFGMLVACAGVANVIIAGIDARRFEFGVIRAVGAQRGVLVRLVLGEVVLISLAACLVGTALGLQGAWAGQVLDAMIAGVDLSMRPPVGDIAASWGIVLALALMAAAPAVVRLARLRTRELLAARPT